MKPWTCLDRTSLPGSSGTLALMRRDDEYEIRLDALSLMNTRQHATEDALGALCCAGLGPTPRVAIGGLGLGFTVAAALRDLPPSARVLVAELVPAVVRWCHGPAGRAAGRPLDDPRVTVHDGDVADLVRGAADRWDAVLLDVDNGPSALTAPSNAALYGDRGIAAFRDALRPGGVLGVWSAEDDPGFERRLRRAGLEVETRRVGGRAVIWLCRRSRGAAPRGARSS